MSRVSQNVMKKEHSLLCPISIMISDLALERSHLLLLEMMWNTYVSFIGCGLFSSSSEAAIRKQSRSGLHHTRSGQHHIGSDHLFKVENLNFPSEVHLHQEIIQQNGSLTFGEYFEKLLDKYYQLK